MLCKICLVIQPELEDPSTSSATVYQPMSVLFSNFWQSNTCGGSWLVESCSGGTKCRLLLLRILLLLLVKGTGPSLQIYGFLQVGGNKHAHISVCKWSETISFHAVCRGLGKPKRFKRFFLKTNPLFAYCSPKIYQTSLVYSLFCLSHHRLFIILVEYLPSVS